MNENGARLIQSTFGNGEQRNFETVVLERGGPRGKQLVHYWRDNAQKDNPWYRGKVISTDATGSASLIENSKSDLELLVLEDRKIAHYRRRKDRDEWEKLEIVSEKASAAPALIESLTKGTHGAPGNYEAVILEDRNLVHYYRDNSQKEPKWRKATTITPNASSPGSLLQSTHAVDSSKPGNLEVVVLEGRTLQHYYRDHSKSDHPWHKGGAITENAYQNGPGTLLQSTYVDKPDEPGNFELVVFHRSQESGEAAGTLTHWWRDNATKGNPWQKTVDITDKAIGPGSIIQSGYGMQGEPGDFEVIVVEEPNTLVHYWRGTSGGWQKGAVISSEALG